MNGCDLLVRDASGGVAAALRAVDCMSAEATASAFSRLFGTSGSLLPALTLLLTLYIGFFAVSLLTGRSRLGISALTPRMLTLGLVLTFATSWAAYQGVVWNLATGAPDQIAGVLMGSQGSATQVFGGRIDILFSAIAEAADQAGQSDPQAAMQGSFTPGNLMWLGALLFMLGTVGLLVTARIALAVLLAVGPVFITLALFGGTRGLFAGWLRAVTLTAITPLFAVLGGAFMLELAVPVVASIRGAEGIDGRAALALFMIAAVHCALMVLAIRVAATMVGGWQVFGLASSTGGKDRGGDRQSGPAVLAPLHGASYPVPHSAGDGRSRSLNVAVAASGAGAVAPASASDTGAAPSRVIRGVAVPVVSAANPSSALPPRTRGIGSRYASRASSQELLR